MITKPEAAKQVARLAQMLGYPKNEPEALNELILAAMAAKDLDTCKRVIGDFIELATPESRCPYPSAIRTAMYAAEKPAYYVQEFAESSAVVCSACSDTGCAGGLGEPWRWCDCAAGTKLRAESPDRVDKLNAMNTAKLPQPSTQRMRSTKTVAEILERV